MTRNEKGFDLSTADQLEAIRYLAQEMIACTKAQPSNAERPTRSVDKRRTPGSFGYVPLAEEIYNERALRQKFFDADFFAEPAWDMILDLFIQMHRKRQISVTSACIASRVPPTTALRWINVLVSRGLVERVSDPTDARRALLQLAQPTLLKLNEYFKAIDDRRL